jgi:hypothetical protein
MVVVEGKNAMVSELKTYIMILPALMHGLDERHQAPVRAWLTAAALAVVSHPLDHLPPEGEPTSHRPGDDTIGVHRISSSHLMNCPDRMQGLSVRASQSTASSPHKSSLALTCAPRFAQEAKGAAVIGGDA